MLYITHSKKISSVIFRYCVDNGLLDIADILVFINHYLSEPLRDTEGCLSRCPVLICKYPGSNMLHIGIVYKALSSFFRNEGGIKIFRQPYQCLKRRSGFRDLTQDTLRISRKVFCERFQFIFAFFSSRLKMLLQNLIIFSSDPAKRRKVYIKRLGCFFPPVSGCLCGSDKSSESFSCFTEACRICRCCSRICLHKTYKFVKFTRPEMRFSRNSFEQFLAPRRFSRVFCSC